MGDSFSSQETQLKCHLLRLYPEHPTLYVPDAINSITPSSFPSQAVFTHLLSVSLKSLISHKGKDLAFLIDPIHPATKTLPGT